MNLLLMSLPLLLVFPAIYLLIKHRSSSKPGDGRDDAAEAPELTGTEQAKRRPPSSAP